MAGIDLSVLPRVIGVLEDLPTVLSLRSRVAVLESQLQEKQQVLDDLQSRPQEAALPQTLVATEDSEFVKALQEKLTAALDLVTDLQKENKQLRDQVALLSQRTALVPVSEQSAAYRKFAQEACGSRLEMLFAHSIWPKFVGFLTVREIYSLGKISPFWKVNICLDPATWEHLAFSLRPVPPLVPEVEEPLQLDDAAKRLMEKYLIEGYVIAKDAEVLLTPITKTLLGLLKAVEIATSSTSSETFTSLPELILSKFPRDKTVELLHKSSAMLAANPAKVGEWVQFIQTSLATAFHLAAGLVSDGRELNRVKEILHERIKKLNHQLAHMAVSQEESRRMLDAEIANRSFLSRRLHDVECLYLQVKSDYDQLQQSAKLLIAEKMKAMEQLTDELAKSEEANSVLLAEVKKVREVLEVTRRQKKELLDAYHDFKWMFDAFNSELAKCR